MECRRRGGKPFFWCVGRKNRLGRRLMLRACLLRLRRRPRDVLPRGLHLSHRTLTPGVASSGCQNGAPVVLVDASFVVDTTRAWRHAAIEHIEPHLGCRCQRKGSPSSGTSIPENRGRTRWARTRKAHGELQSQRPVARRQSTREVVPPANFTHDQMRGVEQHKMSKQRRHGANLENKERGVGKTTSSLSSI
jgi:hypothetical protein